MLARQQAAVLAKGAYEGSERLIDAPGDAASVSPAGEIHAFALMTRGKARGALLLALGPSHRHLAGADLSLADSLAGRAASALDNCVLYEEIQKADRRKNEFLATLSHELRNPLAPMRAALHMLRSQAVEPARSKALLETMDRQVAQMTRLVEDLLDISRITRGAIELRRETLDVNTEIRNALESCQGQIEIGGHRVTVQLPNEPLRVVADAWHPADPREHHSSTRPNTPTARAIESGARASSPTWWCACATTASAYRTDRLTQIWDLFVQVDESPDRIRKGPGNRARP